MKLPVNYNEIPQSQRRLVREEYVKRQNGLCCFCNFPLSQETPASVKEKYPLELKYDDRAMIAYRYTGNMNECTIDMKTGERRFGYTNAVFPKNMLSNPIHLHHDHTTGMTIGAVHAYCNVISFVYVETE